MRNVARQISIGRKMVRKDEALDMMSGEITALYEAYRKKPNGEGVFELITNAYLFGLSVGNGCHVQVDDEQMNGMDSVMNALSGIEDEEKLKLISRIALALS